MPKKEQGVGDFAFYIAYFPFCVIAESAVKTQ